MQKMIRSGVAAALAVAAQAVQASGDSGTAAMGEMQVTGAQLAMMAGGLVGLGVVIWAVVKVVNR